MDFLMPAINSKLELEWDTPMEYNKAVQLARYVVDQMAKWTTDEDKKKKILVFLEQLFGLHGCKATWIDLLVSRGWEYAGHLQGHWKDSKMIERYSRNKM